MYREPVTSENLFVPFFSHFSLLRRGDECDFRIVSDRKVSHFRLREIVRFSHAAVGLRRCSRVIEAPFSSQSVSRGELVQFSPSIKKQGAPKSAPIFCCFLAFLPKMFLNNGADFVACFLADL